MGKEVNLGGEGRAWLGKEVSLGGEGGEPGWGRR